MKGIVEAINYCHHNNICHRDLKLNNILINDKDEIKIIDFGLSGIVIPKHKNLSGKKGTIVYMAPEVINREAYDEKCDIWCIGHIFFVLLTFTDPFDKNDDRKLVKYKV
jgi:serine/threonine protein kinase